jgi:23S rRNA pseudouridine2457 synthase
MQAIPHRYFILYKPYNMVSQFVSSHDVRLLGDLNIDFPEGIHAIGRLDNNSEGLLILTTNKKVTKLLFESKTPHKRTYLVQVKNIVSAESLEQLRKGISIQIKNDVEYIAVPSSVEIINDPEKIFSIDKSIFSYYPFTWLLITLTEGKFHQVRKMVAAIKHRCNRLIRISIEEIKLEKLSPGEIMEMNEKDFFEKLKILNY